MQKQQISHITKHRSQIQKRLNQLQLKFAQTSQPKANALNHPYQYTYDDNKYKERGEVHSGLMMNKPTKRVYNGQYDKENLSKTVDIRKRPQIDTTKLDGYYQQKSVQSLRNNIKNDRQIAYSPNKNVDNSHRVDPKDQKIKQLQSMIKSILDGQKILQKQLYDLKNKHNPINQLSIIDQQKIINQSNLVNECLQRNKRSQINRSNDDRQTDNIKDKKRRLTPLKQKQKMFQEIYMKLRSRGCNGQRMEIGEGARNSFWGEVENRIRQSDREYRDTLHRNNKHQFEHLMNTYQLQRKMKDQLIGKVYQECNHQIYK